jgi:hypothetical protein
MLMSVRLVVRSLPSMIMPGMAQRLLPHSLQLA